MFLPLFATIFISSASACLSKMASDSGNNEVRAITPSAILREPGLDRQTRQFLSQAIYQGRALESEHRSLTREVTRRSEEILHAGDDFGALFGIKVDSSAGLPLGEGQPYQERREKTLLWAAVSNAGDFDAYMKTLKGAEISGNLRKAQCLCFLDLMTGQTILYYNYLFTSIVNEDQIPAFLSYLKTSYNYFYAVSKAAQGKGNRELASYLLNRYRPSEYPLIPAICKVLMTTVQTFAVVADPSTEMMGTAECDLNATIPDFIRVYLDLKALRWITARAVTVIFKEKFHQFELINEVNSKIKGLFYERLNAIKKRMDSQFRDRSDFEVAPVARPVLPARTEKPQSNTTVPTVEAVEQVQNSSLVTGPTGTGGLSQAPLVSIPETKSARSAHSERKQTSAAKKAENELKRREAEAAKHARLVAALEQEKADDKDVHLYYSSISQAASRTFDLNQKNQACKRTYPASARFRHSIYPNITASGTTINFLCSLLVSGTPDYNGFCAAHADLGGMKEDKRNGGKLFYFLDPIKYHKTLHRPHASSDFDHVLYRRFYRNCALHPYYFILSKK